MPKIRPADDTLSPRKSVIAFIALVVLLAVVMMTTTHLRTSPEITPTAAKSTQATTSASTSTKTAGAVTVVATTPFQKSLNASIAEATSKGLSIKTITPHGWTLRVYRPTLSGDNLATISHSTDDKGKEVVKDSLSTVTAAQLFREISLPGSTVTFPIGAPVATTATEFVDGSGAKATFTTSNGLITTVASPKSVAAPWSLTISYSLNEGAKDGFGIAQFHADGYPHKA